jgi:lipopolysaccharide export system protein LptA
MWNTSIFIRLSLFVSILSISTCVFSQKVRKIKYIADEVSHSATINPDIDRLIGHATFKDSLNATIMYCDSAYFHTTNDDIDAFGNIRVVPMSGNTSLSGNIMHYNSAERTAEINGNVVLVDDKTTLTTQTIFYNLPTGVATYPTKGTIVTPDLKIVSDHGAYNRNTKESFFKKNVVVTNPDGIIHTDTMNYNTVTKIVDFLGPTIMTTDKDSIYCEKGWYNRGTEISSFRQNAWLKQKGSIVKGDTLYYERRTGLGKGFGHVEMLDTTNNMIIRGNFANMNRPRQSAIVTKNAYMIQVENKKDSLYLHSDTIRSGIFVENTDTFKFVKAYHHVRFFRTDLQGKCDSMFYSFKDSTLQLIKDPVIWAEGMQLRSENVTIFIKNQTMDHMDMTNSAFITQRQDSIRYNQIKGRNMTGYFKNNEIYKMVVKGNGQSLYFAKEDSTNEITGIMKTESSEITMFMKDKKLQKINYIQTVSGTFHPPFELSGNDLLLKDFIWLETIRPKTWKDIFEWQEVKTNGGLMDKPR